jgi:hypothetical protein
VLEVPAISSCHLINSVAALQGRTPEVYVTRSTPDISPYAMFDWYQPVYYLTPTISFPYEKKILGRWLGVAKNCTDEMAYTVLWMNGVVMIRKSIWASTAEKMGTDMIREQIATLDESLKHFREHDSQLCLFLTYSLMMRMRTTLRLMKKWPAWSLGTQHQRNSMST